MIICAAIKIIKDSMFGVELQVPEELIICGHRHHNCLVTIHHLGPRWSGCKKIQGFINHKGEFLDRKEALAHALECG